MRVVFLFLIFAPVFVGAGELRNLTVDKVDGHYLMHSESWFDVEIEQLFAVILDYDLGSQFSSVIAESRNLEPDEQGRPRYFTRHQTCVLFFCMNFERYGHVEFEQNVSIVSTADAEVSDFHVSKETWQFSEDGDGTLLIYDVDMKPKFWIPPVIGPFYLKRKLIKGGARAVGRIEAIAKTWPTASD